MAPPLETSDWQKRYEVIEKAYCQGRWATVVEAGTLLLRDLQGAGEDPEARALRHRMQLLMAHTLLHGYGDRDAAEDLYEVVRQSDAESALRQIAEDGLDQCHQPLSSTMPAAEDEDDDLVPTRPLLFLPESERNDQEVEARPSKRPQAPSSAALPRLSPLPPSPLEPEPEPAGAAAPFASPAPGIAPGGEPTVNGLSKRGGAVDPFNPSGGEASAVPPQGRAPVMPWLSQPPEPSELAEPMGTSLPWLQETAAPPITVAPALIPDVVEEPELMEVHQSSSLLAEEVDVAIRPSPPATAIEPPLQREAREEEDQDLRTGLLLVVVG